MRRQFPAPSSPSSISRRSPADCNACKTAPAALRSQVTALQTREKALADAARDRAASRSRRGQRAARARSPTRRCRPAIKAFQTKQQQGAQELSAPAAADPAQPGSTSQQQIATKLGPIYQQVMQRAAPTSWSRSARRSRPAPALDVTNDVLAALNTALPTRPDDRSRAAAAAAAGPLTPMSDSRRAPPSARSTSGG